MSINYLYSPPQKFNRIRKKFILFSAILITKIIKEKIDLLIIQMIKMVYNLF